jgi:rhamnulose-1-phosphate aldolase
MMKLMKTMRIMEEIARTASLVCEKGWAERNAGNLSIDITGSPDTGEILKTESSSGKVLKDRFPFLADASFLVTRAGCRMRDVAVDPRDHICILNMDEEGKGYRQFFGTEPGPTSELETHLHVHNTIREKGLPYRSLLHVHCTELIALTHIPELCSSDALSRVLWKMHPETVAFVPKGVGFIPFDLPGTTGLALATATSLENHVVTVWEKHGVFAMGETLGEAFDMIDILAKSARIYFMLKQAGYAADGLTDDQLIQLRKYYRLD